MTTAKATRRRTLSKRIVAWVIDAAAITLLVVAVMLVAGAAFGPTVEFRPDAPALADAIAIDTPMLVLDAVLTTAVSAAYVVIPWAALGASPGQLLLRLRVEDERDGSPLTVGSAVKRWLLVFPPFATVAAFVAGTPPLATLVWAAAVVWYVLLLITTTLSETSQGVHDRLIRDVVRSR